MKKLAALVAFHVGTVVLAHATLVAIGYGAYAIHKRNCKNPNCNSSYLCKN